MKYLFLLICFCFNNFLFSQISFNWEVSPLISIIGPDAISVSPSAFVGVGGSSGLGLNAGLPKKNINLTMSGSVLNVEGMDFSVDYQRDENTGYFITRGSGFRFGMTGGKLRIAYRVEGAEDDDDEDDEDEDDDEDDDEEYINVSATNIYNVPNDDIFRNYRFVYDPNTGVGEVFVDGVSVWVNDGPDNRVMHWNGAGNVKIGDKMDGSGKMKVVFDEMVLTEITMSPLPISLLSFEANLDSQNKNVQLLWKTTSEINNEYFEVERSQNMVNWEGLFKVAGAGNSNSLIEYFETDYSPKKGKSYYRLKQVDYDGKVSYSNIVVVKNNLQSEILNVYPNPVYASNKLNVDIINENDLEEVLVVLRDIKGNQYYTKLISINDNSNRLQIPIDSNLPEGIYLVVASSKDKYFSKKIMVKR